ALSVQSRHAADAVRIRPCSARAPRAFSPAPPGKDHRLSADAARAGASREESAMAIRIERNDMVATIVIDRPEARNAVDGPSARALADAFLEFEADDHLRVAVLWGAGGVFCAGADLKARGTERGLRLAPDGDGPMGPSRMAFAKPTIAAVEGYAVAGGLELSLMCDLLVAGDGASVRLLCRRWGAPLLAGGPVRRPRLIGLSRALDMLLTGRAVEAREALDFGLAHRVVAAGRAREEAETLARIIAN